jgi:hypothetical protein
LEEVENKEERTSKKMKEMEASAEERQTQEARKYSEAIKSLNEDLEKREEKHKATAAGLNEQVSKLEGDLAERNKQLCTAKDKEIESVRKADEMEKKNKKLVSQFASNLIP